MENRYKIADWILANHRNVRELIQGDGKHRNYWIEDNFQRTGTGGGGCLGSSVEAWTDNKEAFIAILDIIDSRIIQKLTYLQRGIYWGKYQFGNTTIGILTIFNIPGKMFYRPANRAKPITYKQVALGLKNLREYTVMVLFCKKLVQPRHLEAFIETFSNIKK